MISIRYSHLKFIYDISKRMIQMSMELSVLEELANTKQTFILQIYIKYSKKYKCDKYI